MKFKISEIAQVVGGGTPSTKEEDNYANSGVAWITPKDLSGYTQKYIANGSRDISEKGLNSSSAKLMPKGTVLVSSRAPIGYVAIADGPLATNQGFKSLVPNKDVVTSEYLYYVMKQSKSALEQVATGTTFKEVSGSVMKNFEIDIPNLDEQERVVSILAPIDQKIELLQTINDNLLELASALFEGSFPNVRGGETAIGTLMSNFDKQRKPLSKNQRAQRQGEYRYIGATSVVDHVDDFTFNGIYLLLGEDGTVQTDDGKPVLQYVWGPFWPNNHTHVLQGKGVSTEWLYLFWKNQNITSIITGAVQPKISQGNMNSIKVTKPSDVELATFQQKIDPIFNMIRLNADEIENLKVIRDQLLKELLG